MLVDETQLAEAVAREVTLERHVVSVADETHAAKARDAVLPDGERADNLVEVEDLAVALADEEVLIEPPMAVVDHAADAVLHALAEAAVVVADIAAADEPDEIVTHGDDLVDADGDVARELGDEAFLVAVVLVGYELHIAVLVDAVEHALRAAFGARALRAEGEVLHAAEVDARKGEGGVLVLLAARYQRHNQCHCTEDSKYFFHILSFKGLS